jgi:hypothetical protein
MYAIQHYVIQFISDLRQVSGFFCVLYARYVITISKYLRNVYERQWLHKLVSVQLPSDNVNVNTQGLKEKFYNAEQDFFGAPRTGWPFSLNEDLRFNKHVRYTTLCDTVYQWLATGLWFFLCTLCTLCDNNFQILAECLCFFLSVYYIQHSVCDKVCQ